MMQRVCKHKGANQLVLPLKKPTHIREAAGDEHEDMETCPQENLMTDHMRKRRSLDWYGMAWHGLLWYVWFITVPTAGLKIEMIEGRRLRAMIIFTSNYSRVCERTDTHCIHACDHTRGLLVPWFSLAKKESPPLCCRTFSLGREKRAGEMSAVAMKPNVGIVTR